jgi:hypothetical protein
MKYTCDDKVLDVICGINSKLKRSANAVLRICLLIKKDLLVCKKDRQS